MEATTVRSGSSRRINFVVRVDEDWTYGNWRFEHYQHMIQRAPYERFMDRLGGTIASRHTRGIPNHCSCRRARVGARPMNPLPHTSVSREWRPFQIFRHLLTRCLFHVRWMSAGMLRLALGCVIILLCLSFGPAFYAVRALLQKIIRPRNPQDSISPRTN
jgi:hypothetical protein